MGVIVTVVDLAIVLIFIVALMILAAYQKLDNKEVDQMVLMPSDFTVAVTSLPKKGHLYKEVDELKFLLWNHFENLNKFVGDYLDPDDKNPNHNEVVSIYFGFPKYSKLGNLKNIALYLK